MSESKHTQGPWRRCGHSWSDESVYGADDSVVCSHSIEGDCTEETQEKFEALNAANMRLIAAAPELLEGLKELRDAVNEGWFSNGEWADGYLMAADAVIAKATGEDCAE